VVREGVGQGGEMTQALYAHMNNKKILKIKKEKKRKRMFIKVLSYTLILVWISTF
jgi:hypothetical protein